jgi:hypothetical protein
VPLRLDLIQLLGQQNSIANYIRQLFNLFELSGIEKSQLMAQSGVNFGLKNTSICLDCGNRSVTDENHPILSISNETAEISKKKTVKVKIIYISDFDNYKKYEITMAPGEYAFNEVIGKIKEKVQMDRI